MSSEKGRKGRRPRGSNRSRKGDGRRKEKNYKSRKRGDKRGKRRSGPRGKPRIEESETRLVLYVRSPPKFADDIIRREYVDPAIDKLNRGRVEEIVFKAMGRAINVAVRAALLLEGVMGVMKRIITISSRFESRGSRGGGGDEKSPRVISSMEIKCLPW